MEKIFYMNINKKKVALFGAGSIARKKYFLFDDLFRIECCYDNGEVGGVLYGTPIRKWEKGEKTVFIIITTDYWKEIAEQLEEEGLELGKDYLPYYIFDELNYISIYHLRKDFLNGKYLEKELEYTSFLPNKKLAVLYGNCQTGVYRKALTISKEFKEEYVIIEIPQVWEYRYQPEAVGFFLKDRCFWKTIKLFIYQYISKANHFFDGLASEFCFRKLSDDCQKVAISSLDFRGYFPQIEEFVGGLFRGYRDKYVDALIQQNIKSDDIIDMVSEERFIDDVEIESCIKESLSSVKKRDSYADIKIYDYVEKNYMEQQLFYSPFHPCDNLIKEYTKRIFMYLGLKWDITDEYFAGICSAGIMRGADIVIYPSVVKKLGLKKYENRFYFDREYASKNMVLDFRQCMEMYIKFQR